MEDPARPRPGSTQESFVLDTAKWIMTENGGGASDSVLEL